MDFESFKFFLSKFVEIKAVSDVSDAQLQTVCALLADCQK